METTRQWYVRTEEGRVYGPAAIDLLATWARDGRIEPTGFVSQDRISWMPAQQMPELEMKWLVEAEPGKVFGPFNRAVVSRLFKDGSAPEGAKAYRLHEFPIDEDEPQRIVEKIVEVEKPVEVIKEVVKEVVKEVRVEVPVEKIVEKVVEVEKPARTSLVVPEVVEPDDAAPPAMAPGSIFGGASRERLAALEAAAQREIAKGRRFGLGGGIFGGRR